MLYFYSEFFAGHKLFKSSFSLRLKAIKKYKDTEQKWFGGVLGGHVGIEADSDKVVNFLPGGKFHCFAKKNNKHSSFAVHTVTNFHEILGGKPEAVKKAIMFIPVTIQQKQKFGSIASVYFKNTPCEYALMGMRCGAAAHDMLAQLDILTSNSQRKTYRKIFYPKKLRKRLLKKASINGWKVVRQKGSNKRKWEKD